MSSCSSVWLFVWQTVQELLVSIQWLKSLSLVCCKKLSMFYAHYSPERAHLFLKDKFCETVTNNLSFAYKAENF